jgi:hypothetical protein
MTRLQSTPLLPYWDLTADSLVEWCGVAAWAWLLVCAIALARAPRTPAAGARWGVGAAGLLATWLFVPHGPMEPNHHGVRMWAVLSDVSTRYLVTDAKHGGAHLWLLRQGWRLGLPDDWLALPAVAVAALSTVALGAAVGAVAGPRAGVLATAILAVWPPHARIATSLSAATFAEFGGCLAVLGVTRRAFGGGAWWTGLAVGGVALTTTVRAEWLALGPLGLAVAWVIAAIRPTRADLLAAVAPISVIALRGWTFLKSPELDIVSRPDLSLLPALMGYASTALFGAIVAPRLAARWRERSPWVGVVAIIGAAALALLAWPGGFRGVFHPWPLSNPLRLHAWAHPDITSPGWAALSVVGLAVALAAAPWRSTLAAAWLTAAIGLYAIVATYDSPSTYLRGAPATGWLLCAAAALGADRAAPAGPRGAALLGVVGALSMAATAPFLRYRWPDAEEYRMIARARAERADGVVVSLLRSDLPPGSERLAINDREFVEDGLHARRPGAGPPPPEPWLVGVDAALADPDAVIGGLWLETLACYRVVPPSPNGGPKDVFAGDRIWRIEGRPPSPTPPAPPDREPPITIIDTPCWDQPELAQGATCPRGVRPSGRPYVDPRCVAMAERFVLEPLDQAALGGGNLSGSRLHVDHPAPRVGVYLIAGRR